jgi:hypothetical protein
VAAAEAAGPNATRTLVLRVDRSPARVRWALLRGGGTVLGDGAAALAALGATRAERDADVVLPVLARLLAADARDSRRELAALAVGSVAVLPPADPGTVLALDAAPGLTRGTGSGGTLVWRVDPPAADGVGRPARARVVDPATGRALEALPSTGDGVAADLDAGPPGRLFVLAERASGGWRADLDGVALEPARWGWAQAFVLPARGGRLEVWHDDGRLARVGGPARAGVLGLALLVALPLPRLRGRVGPAPAPRPSRPVPRPAPAPDDLVPGTPPQVFGDDHREGAVAPLYVGPPPRGLRRMRRARLARLARLARRARPRPPGGPS